jgi:hypothetical protein
LAEWLYEAGIGEARAALVDNGAILEMAIERDDKALRAGAILSARLTRKADASGRGLVTFADGATAQLMPVPGGLTEGSPLLVEIIRETLPEGGGFKPPRARAAPPGATQTLGPDLLARIGAGGLRVRRLGPDFGLGPDLLEQNGWSEALEEATSGIIARPEAMLRISLTPAMTLIDVDGAGSAAELAKAGARLSGQVIRRFGISGSIGIDLPTMAGKAERQAAATALDMVLPQPFERTSVNGFGFLQIVRRKMRASLPDQIAADPVLAAALALLRRAERATGHGPLALHAAPAVLARLSARQDWLDALAARIGATVALREDARLAISAAYASRSQN